MIGYITSADEHGDVTNPEITVIYGDDFYPGFDDMPKKVYAYNRMAKSFSEVFSSGGEFEVHLYSLLGAVELLELEEMRCRLAVKVFWKDGFSQSITHVKSEYLDGVWFPSPVLTDGCKQALINITEFIYSKTPSTLETSFLCDVLNMICAVGITRISAPFYCCCNSVFVDSSLLKLLCHMVGEEAFYKNISPHTKRILEALPSFDRNFKKDIAKIRKCLENMAYEEKEYTGTRHSFAINIKRTCLRDVLELVKSVADGKLSLKELAQSICFSIDSAIKRFVTLSELFKVSGNLEKSEDIRFLTLYELMSAYAFSENEISLKSSVRHGRERITHINKSKVPQVIYSDGRTFVEDNRKYD